MEQLGIVRFTATLLEEGSGEVRRIGEGKSDCTMTLYARHDGTSADGFIAWDVDAIQRHEIIFVWWNAQTRELVDFDGVMVLPDEAVTLLEWSGISVGSDFR
jgi:hypothetical protein